jgi:hypothetical protein
MRTQGTASRGVAVALVATLLLRAGIPDGYMPSPAGSGFLFELCPAGVPVAFMQALAGPGAHLHHGGDESASAHFDAAQCPIGHLLSATVAIDMQWPDADSPALADLPALPEQRRESTSLLTRRTRDPPA